MSDFKKYFGLVEIVNNSIEINRKKNKTKKTPHIKYEVFFYFNLRL